jgi:TonB family protein
VARSLLASAVLHALVLVAALLLGTVSAARRSSLPPVYSVQLVSAAEFAPLRTRPEPRPEPPVEEETPEEPEAVEKVPDAKEPAPSARPAREEGGREPTPRPGREAAPRTGPDLPMTLEGRPFQFPWYLEEIYRKVSRNWRPPSRTALKTTVHFRIARNGRLSDVEIENSSGNFLFDQAALRAIEASSPMPPLPAEYGGDWLGVFFDFDAELRTTN